MGDKVTPGVSWEQLELPFGELAGPCPAGQFSVYHNALAAAEYDAEQLWRAGLRLSRNLVSRRASSER